MPERLLVHEVAARDGLQNEAALLSTTDKLALLARLAESRPDSLEVTSFVRPDRVPQLADADDLCRTLADQPWREGQTLVGLVMNLRGYERFRQSGLDAITAVIGAHEGFSQANSGMSIDRALEANRELIAAARADGFPVRLYLSMAFGSPQDGPTPEQDVFALVQAAAEMGVERVMLSDTVGVGTPEQVESLVQGSLTWMPMERIGLHMHDTFGRALENVAAGVALGVRRVDASAGGSGGCPFAPGAAGNLATGALLAWAKAQNLPCDSKSEQVDEAARFLASRLNRPLAMGGAREALS
jgi:hydroxymethylglutaryl-CoA lyase